MDGKKFIAIKRRGDSVILIKPFNNISEYEEVVFQRDLISSNSLLKDDHHLVEVLKFMENMDITDINYSYEDQQLSCYFSKLFWPCVYVVYDAKEVVKESYSANKKYWKVPLNDFWYMKKVSCDI